jgi:hypothetical protein
LLAGTLPAPPGGVVAGDIFDTVLKG